ncbi:hypothetical protein ACT6QH_10485 [Xanthobacter sp. TB0139]|uniref:hypothetical protein n=1 Tax=Xanthobacter sp. TB0139 TaxID=3459178 RepID=UPI004039A2E1
MRKTIFAALGSATLAVAPASAEQLSPEKARAFVVGRTFSFSCFEGSSGQGKVHADGSVAGTISLRARPLRYVKLPANTLRVRDGAVCGYLKGMAFEPCFDVVRTGSSTFRGTLAGVSTMWCDFKHVGRERARMASRHRRD